MLGRNVFLYSLPKSCARFTPRSRATKLLKSTIGREHTRIAFVGDKRRKSVSARSSFTHSMHEHICTFTCALIPRTQSSATRMWDHSGIRPCKEWLMGVSVVGELAAFMGRWFYERIWPIHHPLTSPVSCAGVGKRYTDSPASLADRIPGTVQVHRRRDRGHTLRARCFSSASTHRAFLISLREFPAATEAVAAAATAAGRPSWFYTVMKLFTRATRVACLCRARWKLCSRIIEVAWDTLIATPASNCWR